MHHDAIHGRVVQRGLAQDTFHTTGHLLGRAPIRRVIDPCLLEKEVDPAEPKDLAP